MEASTTIHDVERPLTSTPSDYGTTTLPSPTGSSIPSINPAEFDSDSFLPRHRSAAILSSQFHRRDSDPSVSRNQLHRHTSLITNPQNLSSLTPTTSSNPFPGGQINALLNGIAMGIDDLKGYSSSLNYLLIFVPISIIFGLFFKNQSHSAVIIFITSFIGMIPLAMILGKATEDIAEHTNDTLGALVNVTFGNAVELILSISALQAGKMTLIRDTIAGSILSNLLLVLGSSFFFGGLRHYEQEVLPAVSEANADLLSFSVFGLSIPALYSMSSASSYVHGPDDVVSLLTSIGLLIIYVMYIIFQLFTHADLYRESPSSQSQSASQQQSSNNNNDNNNNNSSSSTMIASSTDMEQPALHDEETVQEEEEEEEKIAPLPLAIGILISMVILVAITSEFLVDSIDEFSRDVGLNERFIAVILLPVVGNAVEHMSAILVARHNKIDLSIGIACGSSVQIALFAAPLLVVISWFTGNQHLTLDFDMFAILCIGFSVFIVNATMRDSRTNWLEGAVLVMCYLIIAAAFFLMKDV